MDDRIDSVESLCRDAAIHGVGHRDEDSLRIDRAWLCGADADWKFDERSERLHGVERDTANTFERRSAHRHHRGARFHGFESPPAFHDSLQLEFTVSGRKQLAAGWI